MGAYVVRTSSSNDKRSCQLFRTAASFSSLVLLVSTAKVSCCQRPPFLLNSVLSPRFNLLRVAKRCFSWFPIFSFSCLKLIVTFLCSSVSEALVALGFSFLSERFFLDHAKAKKYENQEDDFT